MGQWTAAAVVTAAVAVSAGGCGGRAADADHEEASAGGTSGGSGGAPEVPAEIQTFVDELNQIACDWLHPCCTEVGTPITATDCANCLSVAANPEGADPASYSFDPDVAAECLTAARELYGALSCDLDARPGEYDARSADLETLCAGAFRGKLEPGTPCTGHIECAAAPGDLVECTDFFDNFPEPVCVVRRRVGEGAACFWTCTGGVCWGSSAGPPTGLQGQCGTEDQLYCEAGVCVRQSVPGEPCSGSGVCAESVCEDGVCTLAERVTCDEHYECHIGYYCESASCAPEKPPGAPCESAQECESGSCSDDGSCVEAAYSSVDTMCANLALWN